MHLKSGDIGELLRAGAEARRDGVKDAVAWLAVHAHDYKPEALAENMARDLLGDD